MTGHLIVTDEDATRVIKLRRPEKKNAITQDMYRAMSEAIDTAQNNPAIRCLIITGGSGVFTAGNDLEDFLKDGTSNTDMPARLQRHQVPLFARAQRQADHRRGRRRLRSASAPPCCSIAITCSPVNDRDVLDAVHPSRAGAGRRLQPADAAHHGPPACVCDAGDGAHGQRRRARKSPASSMWWWRPATPRPRRARWRARSARCRRKRSRSRASF